MLWILSFILSFGSLQAMGKPSASIQADAIVENVGVRTLHYQDAGRNRPVVVELWYPTQQAGPLDHPLDDIWIHPNEIREGSLSDRIEKYRLIVMSHGHKGDRRDRSWLAEPLVQKGFIVASVEHYGNSGRTYNPLISLRFWERARDISFAISELLKESSLKDRIDPAQVGFIGYSLGGITGLSLAGAKAKNVKEIVKRQQEQRGEIDLELIERVDFSDAERNFADPRIKALVLLSPATFVFPPKSLKQVKIPVALVASVDDEVLPHKEHAVPLITHLIPAKLKLLRNKISHYVFLNPVSEVGKDSIRKEVWGNGIQSDRSLIHKEVGVFAGEFFDQELK